MTINPFFTASVLGMTTQSYALQTIGANIANVNSGGYKRTDTLFQTVLSKGLFQNHDLGGVRPKDYQRIDVQGAVLTSENNLDVAINGSGFFIVSPTLNGSERFYTRDGAFQVKVESDGAGYLVDKNGYYILGWEPEADGTFSNSGSLQPLRVDFDFFANTFEPTTEATIGLNLPANNPVIDDHAAAVAQFVAGNRPDGFESYTFSVVDSEGVRQTVRLNFTKSASNTWEVSATIEQDPIAQVDTITLAGTIEAGEIYSVTVNGTAFSYTTTGGEAGIDDVRTALVNQINASTAVNTDVTAAAGGTGEIVITASTAGDAFTSSASVSSLQVDTVTLSGTVEAGDTYSVTVDGNTVTYVVTGLEADLDAIRDALVAAINADGTVGPLVTAAAGGSGQITLTGANAGTAFVATASFTDFGGTADNGITIATTSAADNTATAATTTANGLPTSTTTATTLNFTDKGVLDPATPLTYSLAFDSGATADFEVDVTRLTQFASNFLPLFSDTNGFEKSFLISLNWDTAGHLVGNFGNENDRKLYKVPLAMFVNPNGLQMHNGMVFAESERSGGATIVAVDTTGQATFVPNAREISNVRLEDEFARMIATQAVYNANALSFKTVDEMTSVARDLKA